MSTSTTRAGLTKPSGSASPAEYVDVTVLNTNADTIDKLLGYILVNDGVTPANADLIDGAVVREKTSGIIWEARANGGGGFDKIYVRYPFHFQASSTSTQSIATSAAIAQANIDTVSVPYCKNASAANISSSAFKAPVKGIYQWSFRVAWDTNTTGDRYIHYMLNGATVTGDEYSHLDSADSLEGSGRTPTQDLSNTTILNVNDTIAPGVQQSSGGNLNVTKVWVKVALIEPIQ